MSWIWVKCCSLYNKEKQLHYDMICIKTIISVVHPWQGLVTLDISLLFLHKIHLWSFEIIVASTNKTLTPTCSPWFARFGGGWLASGRTCPSVRPSTHSLATCLGRNVVVGGGGRWSLDVCFTLLCEENIFRITQHKRSEEILFSYILLLLR